MSSLQLIQDIGILNKGLALLNIGFSPIRRGNQQYDIPCHCLRLADGSLSALWPASFEQPPLLRFLPMLTRAEQQKGQRIRFALSLKIPALAGIEPLTLYASLPVLRKLNHYPEWSIFIACQEQDRRMLVWHRDKNGQAGVTKLSLSIPAAKGIFRERTALQQTLPKGMIAPKCLQQKGYALTLEDRLDIKDLKAPRQRTDLPTDLIQDWLIQDLKSKPLGQTGWYRDAQYWLLGQHSQMAHDPSEILQQKIRLFFECMAPEASVQVARAHGDFTPRHLHMHGTQLLVTGWRRSEDELPAMYDWFHFVYYSRTILDKKPFAAIRKEIDDTLSEPQWESFLLQHELDAGEAEQQYLLCAISRSLQRKEYTGKGTQNLLQTWCEALGFWMDFEGILTHRQIVLQDIMHFLHEQPYIALGLPDPDISMLPLSERLELVISPTTTQDLSRFLKEHRGILRLQSHRNEEGWRFSVFLCGGSAIHIHCINHLRYRRYVYGDMGALLGQSVFNEWGVRSLPRQAERAFSMFRHALHHQGSSAADEQSLPELKRVLPFLKNLSPDETRQTGILSGILNTLRQEVENKGIPAWRQRLRYFKASMLRLMPIRGFVITFSGVDEAGQRSVIEATRHRIRQELQVPVVVLPHRPSLAIIKALKKSSRKLVLQGHTTRSSFPHFSFLRPIEDLLVQFHVLFRFVLRGYVVLYDQFYSCQEPQAHKVKLPSVLTHWWHRFLLKPDLNVLLYAPAELVKQRRQELSTEDIEHITGEYLALFQKMGQRSGHGDFISVRNTKLGDTLETVFRAIHTQQPPK
ncbi:MAG: hypothetical protein JST06_02365 [Bacteroidetes bacterium]|nr:hypothetical protein [Bacteroidota bacterium]